MTSNETPRRLRKLLLGAAATAAVAGLVAPLPAQDANPADSAELQGEGVISLTPADLRAMMSRGGGSAGSTDGLPSMDKVVDGLKKISSDEGGLFDLYVSADPADKNPSALFAVIPPSLLGDDLLLATSISAGPMAAYQASDYLVRFERRGNNLVLVVPDLSNRGSGPVADSVNRTYLPSILTTLPIRASGPGGSLVVDMTPLTLGGAIPVPGLRGGASPQLSRHPKVKVFPENVLIDAELVSNGRSGLSQAGMSYSFRKLPNRRNPANRYDPRMADERLGYFLTVSQDWGKPNDAKDTTDRYINRWRLEKLDPSLEMSPPKEPIVFYVEKTVPIQWRRYVQDGIDEWNKAFEKVGIVGAIQVRQQTDTDYADKDPEDARYNFIRWIVTGRAFAMGPSRVDPRTGQILDADIIFDDSMLRYFTQDIDLLGPASLARELGPDTLEFWKENPGFRPMGMSDDDVAAALLEAKTEQVAFTAAGSNFGVGQDANGHLDAQNLIRDLAGETTAAQPHFSRLSPESGICNAAEGARHQLSVAHLLHSSALHAALNPTTKPGKPESEDHADHADAHADADAMDEAGDAIEEAVDAAADAVEAVEKAVSKQSLPEEYLGLVLKEVVAHEVGHTLGLRHNFKASAWLSLEEIKARRDDPSKPTVSSVMDYNPILLFAGDDPKKVKSVATAAIGPYDEWVIEYGYTITPRRGGEAILEKIASKSGRKELAYATDEDTTGLASPDPYVNRYDMGDDPIAWAKSRVELANELMEGVEDWAVEEGDPNEYLRRAYLSLMGEKLSATTYVARLVGGQHFSRTRFDQEVTTGDQPGLTPLDPAVQREALTYLAETVLADDFYATDAELLNKIVPSRMPGVRGWPGSRIDFPIHDTILNAQNRALSPLCNPTVLDRLYDAELKQSGDDVFTVAEVIGTVSDSVWGDLNAEGDFNAKQPMLSSIRRNLQTQHLNYLLSMADSEPGRLMNADIRNMVRYQLRQLADKIDAALERNAQLDMASAAHLSESRARIEAVLNAPHMTATGGGGQTIIMMGQPAREN